MNEKIDKFWDLDTIGIKENETSVYDRFISDIKFENGRYSVSLPFKKNRPILPLPTQFESFEKVKRAS